MHFRNRSVSLDCIQTQDQAFRITTQKDVRELSLSIAAVGLLSLPLFIERKTSYQIVSGFRRIAACLALGMTSIEGRILDADTSALNCIRIAVSENLFQRPLNIIEQANALQLIRNASTHKNYVEVAHALGMQGGRTYFEKLLRIKQLDQSIQIAILDGVISLTTAKLLETVDTVTGRILARLFQELRVGLNKQREIIEMVKEISVRDAITPQMLLTGRDVKTILDRDDLDRNQKTFQLRHLLKQKRFPRLVAVEKEFKQQVKALHLGPDLHLSAPRHFEGPKFTFHIEFQDMSELNSALKTLKQITVNPHLADIINLKRP
jgi:ParB family chromosome partitioning protein